MNRLPTFAAALGVQIRPYLEQQLIQRQSTDSSSSSSTRARGSHKEEKESVSLPRLRGVVTTRRVPKGEILAVIPQGSVWDGQQAASVVSQWESRLPLFAQRKEEHFPSVVPSSSNSSSVTNTTNNRRTKRSEPYVVSSSSSTSSSFSEGAAKGRVVSLRRHVADLAHNLQQQQHSSVSPSEQASSFSPPRALWLPFTTRDALLMTAGLAILRHEARRARSTAAACSSRTVGVRSQEEEDGWLSRCRWVPWVQSLPPSLPSLGSLLMQSLRRSAEPTVKTLLANRGDSGTGMLLPTAAATERRSLLTASSASSTGPQTPSVAAHHADTLLVSGSLTASSSPSPSSLIVAPEKGDGDMARRTAAALELLRQGHWHVDRAPSLPSTTARGEVTTTSALRRRFFDGDAIEVVQSAVQVDHARGASHQEEAMAMEHLASLEKALEDRVLAPLARLFVLQQQQNFQLSDSAAPSVDEEAAGAGAVATTMSLQQQQDWLEDLRWAHAMVRTRAVRCPTTTTPTTAASSAAAKKRRNRLCIVPFWDMLNHHHHHHQHQSPPQSSSLKGSRRATARSFSKQSVREQEDEDVERIGAGGGAPNVTLEASPQPSSSSSRSYRQESAALPSASAHSDDDGGASPVAEEGEYVSVVATSDIPVGAELCWDYHSYRLKQCLLDEASERNPDGTQAYVMGLGGAEHETNTVGASLDRTATRGSLLNRHRRPALYTPQAAQLEAVRPVPAQEAQRLRQLAALTEAEWVWCFGFAPPMEEKEEAAKALWQSRLGKRVALLSDVRRRARDGEFVVGVPAGVRSLREQREALQRDRYQGASIFPPQKV